MTFRVVLDNVLSGSSAVNTLFGGLGNDIYDGGAGDDTLADSAIDSNDTYKWGIGYGTDTIQDSGGALDHVDLSAGIAQSQVTFLHNGNNLELTVAGQVDRLIVKDWTLSAGNQIEEFRFSDGSKVLASQVQSLVNAMAAFGASDAGGLLAHDMKTIGTPINHLAANSLI